MKPFSNLQFAICNFKFAIPLGLILFSCISPSAMAQAQSGRPLDDELLKNLKAQSKTDIERELLGTGEKKANLQTGAGQGPADLNRRAQARTGAAAEKENDNPLLDIAQNMFQVQERIAQIRRRTGHAKSATTGRRRSGAAHQPGL